MLMIRRQTSSDSSDESVVEVPALCLSELL